MNSSKREKWDWTSLPSISNSRTRSSHQTSRHDSNCCHRAEPPTCVWFVFALDVISCSVNCEASKALMQLTTLLAHLPLEITTTDSFLSTTCSNHTLMCETEREYKDAVWAVISCLQTRCISVNPKRRWSLLQWKRQNKSTIITCRVTQMSWVCKKHEVTNYNPSHLLYDTLQRQWSSLSNRFNGPACSIWSSGTGSHWCSFVTKIVILLSE